MQDWEYEQIKRQVQLLLGVDLNHYKSEQMRRRLDTLFVRSGCESWNAYLERLRNDPESLREFGEYLTIKVSSFFRDVDKFTYLGSQILPGLLKARPSLRIWSAGCAHGSEPYSIAILLAEFSSPWQRHRILATDVDRTALAQAQAGGPYSAEEVSTVAPYLLARYFRRTADGYMMVDRLRAMIDFQAHDLLHDPFESDFDLIVCRNVVIYFTDAAKDNLYRRFNEALRPGGILFVGGTEIIPRSREIGFTSVAISFYQRTDSQ